MLSSLKWVMCKIWPLIMIIVGSRDDDKSISIQPRVLMEKELPVWIGGKLAVWEEHVSHRCFVWSTWWGVQTGLPLSSQESPGIPSGPDPSLIHITCPCRHLSLHPLIDTTFGIWKAHCQETETEGDWRPHSLFPACFLTSHLNSDEATCLLKHLSVETGSGQEIYWNLAFFQ